MATLQPFPKFRAFDANGNPLTGGKVYTYAAGTSTPLVTYTNSIGGISNQNTNPVTLDANGEANIWYGDNLYKLSLFNSVGVLQWTIDNIGSGSTASTTTGGFGAATDVASASLVDLGAVSSHFANITGTTTINSFGSSALLTAPIYLIKFESALTLTNSANLFLPTGTDVTTAQNDRALVEYLGSGAWRVFSYMRANGTPLLVNTISQDISFTGVITPTALAANTNDWAPTGFATASTIRVSASAPYNLTGIAGGSTGRTIFLENVGVFPIILTNDATSIAANRFYCPASVNFTLYPNAAVILQYDNTSTHWRVISGQAVRTGQPIQGVYNSTTSSTTITAVVPFDNTPPTTSETTLILTSTVLVPTSATNKLRVTINIQGTSGAPGSQLVGCLYRDAGTDAVAVAFTGGPAINISWAGSLIYEVAAGSTASTQFSLRAGVNVGTNYVNSGNATALFNGTLVTSILVQEIAA